MLIFLLFLLDFLSLIAQIYAHAHFDTHNSTKDSYSISSEGDFSITFNGCRGLELNETKTFYKEGNCEEGDTACICHPMTKACSRIVPSSVREGVYRENNMKPLTAGLAMILCCHTVLSKRQAEQEPALKLSSEAFQAARPRGLTGYGKKHIRGQTVQYYCWWLP